ncbi:G3E family GTPase [Kitasatospora sp. MAA4]|uniref:CobW family GTP-binding protein n=1 Tax=Kitasatospora sp. MAA4 TaxID=3035093 RepID=UPI002475A80A|nr:GTP-binding protein [Kitasatospora sp. MAA4]MDH6137929.1 G3E family GTPase [Kitasatospora sp. MAA4]
MSPSLLPVVVVGGLHEAERRQAVLELLADCEGAVVLHHDLTRAGEGKVHRGVWDTSGPLGEAHVPLTNDCPCCALREDLLPELLRIARAGRHRLAVVEMWGGSDLHPLTELIAGGEAEGHSLEDFVEVVGVVTAVDPLRTVPDLSVSDALHDRLLHTCADDERTLAEALAHQVEYANVLAITVPQEASGSEELHAGLAMLRQLRPTARVVRLGVGALAAAARAGFDVAAARDRVNPALAQLPQAADEGGVATLVWERRQPLHPGRLYEALDQLVPAAQRSRGRFWLANRPELMLAWDAAGANLAVEECGPWLATLPDARWDLYPPQRRAAAALDWHPVHGDRVQQLSFTAQGLDVDGITELLDSCLLTDAELAAGEPGWKALPDAFDELLEPVN